VDLVVSDVVMPHMGGAELAARLRSMNPGVRVLFMSGYTERGATFQLTPGSSFLQKPFTAAMLAHRVRELLDAPPDRGNAHP
jgi:two-component SAPR family response regulator